MSDRMPHDDDSQRDEILRDMDACRPGSDDLARPELARLRAALAEQPDLARLYDKSQRLDARLEDALQQVPVPADLQARLLARLAEERLHPASPPAEASAAVRSAERGGAELDLSEAVALPPDAMVTEGRVVVVREPAVETATSQAGRVTRRRWLAMAMATAAALLVITWLAWPARQLTPERVLSLAQQYYHDDPAIGSGTPLSVTPPPRQFPFSPRIVRHRPAWREIEGFLGRKGVAYDLRGPGDIRATLYVVRVKGATPNSPEVLGGLPSAPRVQPASSGGFPTEAWQEDGLLYVLVVEGNQQDYRNFLNQRDMLLTNLPGNVTPAVCERGAQAVRIAA